MILCVYLPHFLLECFLLDWDLESSRPAVLLGRRVELNEIQEHNGVFQDLKLELSHHLSNSSPSMTSQDWPLKTQRDFQISQSIFQKTLQVTEKTSQKSFQITQEDFHGTQKGIQGIQDDSQALNPIGEREDKFVLDACALARAWGLKRGMPERRARAHCPGAYFGAYELERAMERQRDFYHLLLEFSPCIELVAPGMAYVNLGKGKLDSLRQQALIIQTTLLQNLRIKARLSLAPNRLTARFAMRLAKPGEIFSVCEEERQSFLDSQSPTFLPLSQKTLKKLDQLGLVTFGQLAGLSYQDLRKQFREEGELLYSWSRGKDFRPVQALIEEEKPELSVYLESALLDVKSLFHHLCENLDKLFSVLRPRRLKTSRICMNFRLENSSGSYLELGLSEPGDQLDDCRKLLFKKLTQNRFDSPVVFYHIHLRELVQERKEQLSLSSYFAARRSGFVRLKRSLERVLSKGFSVFQPELLFLESRLPERRACLKHIRNENLRRSLYQPRQLKVRADSQGSPHRVKTREGFQLVIKVLEQWLIEEDWWDKVPIRRRYFRVLLSNQQVLDLFQDLRSRRWFRQRI